MSTSVTMPALGESVSEGTVTRWLKQEGEQVEVDEPLLEVSTDKVDTEIPSPAAGILTKIVVAEDETVAVGAELAVIGGAEGSQPDQDQSDQGQSDQSGAEDPGAPADVQPPSEQPQQAQAPAEQQAQAPAEQQAQAPAEQPATAPSPNQRGGDQGGTSVTMPALGESVTEGTVTRWLKAEGEQVEVDEPLLEVSTDKVDTEIPSPAAGILTKIVVAEDETVAVGAELAVIGGGAGSSGQSEAAAPAPSPESPATAAQAAHGQAQSGEAESTSETASAPAQPASGGGTSTSLISAPAPQAQQSQPAAAPSAGLQAPAPSPQAAPESTPDTKAAPQQQAATAGSEGAGDPTYVTPLVRKLAAEHKVDLASLSGTGVGGRVRKQDVLDAATATAAAKAAAEAPAAPAAAALGLSGSDSASGSAAKPQAAASPSPLRGTTEKMSRLRKVIATRMVESLQVSAQLTTVVEVDLTKIARLRQRAKADFEAREGVKLSYLPFMALATVEALKAHPSVNASIDTERGEITYHGAEHLGVAVDTERGLLVPVVRDAGDLNIAGLARKIGDLAARTRNNKITPDELGGGTFTLTNTGSRGALFDTPIINQPQVGILGTGAVVKRAVVIDDSDLGETIAIRSMCYLALSYDHRLVDGADAARFLTTVKNRLEEGAFESDLGL